MLQRIFHIGRKYISEVRYFSTNVVTPKMVDKEKALRRFLLDKIRATGPITVAEYMKTVISAPDVGFYSSFSENKQIFGNRGDFITSPELSQMFGEMIGVWIYYELANTGHQKEWFLIENGPGIGTLMNDVLQTLSQFNERNVSVHLVEKSDALIKEQERVLCFNKTSTGGNESYIKKNITRHGFPIYWYRNIDDIPESFSVFIANEFLDALPIHQFVKDKNGKWHEIYVTINKDNNEFVFMESKGENLHTRGLIKDSIRNDENREFFEISPEAGTYVNQVAERLTQYGGFGLMIDYGHKGNRNTLSLRAYSNHDQVHPLSSPGAVDITADVDFLHLKSLIEDRTIVYGPQSQKEFLGQLGIELRLRRMLQTCKNIKQQRAVIESYKYLMGEMGELFFALSVFPKTLRSILEKRGAPTGFKGSESSINNK